MYNPYKNYLDSFFETITEFKHTSKRLNTVLQGDAKKYTEDGARYFSGTKLFISDWTGPLDNGWKIPFSTGVKRETFKENYAIEIDKILSREFGLAYAQCYEAFETVLKDFIDIKIKTDQNFKKSLPIDKNYSREYLRGSYEIFKIVKKAGGNKFKEYSNQNNNNFKFSELFKIFTEIRHAITHSKGILNSSKIPKDEYYQSLFEHLLKLNNFEGDLIQLRFDYVTLEKLLIYLSEFAYQIFKILSEEDNYEWNYKLL
ncbi:hypothetical protein KO500_05575 [Cellulophaga baltica]|uniref:hypothetical protein n=1 Tax=Cellulophaga TaxID=104264 RepID=UPI001C06606E|nr:MULTISPECIES: hypothetical protein [Cellulophaga]MBU2995891.1 hypothetical protein [Cellulophaga baltica]MDO6767286.1 hypothetical protein [Cellulophaga sp. 1_MG-2023]